MGKGKKCVFLTIKRKGLYVTEFFGRLKKGKEGVGKELGGGGVESGGKRHRSTLECPVSSNPPHSQGVLFSHKKLHTEYLNYIVL